MSRNGLTGSLRVSAANPLRVLLGVIHLQAGVNVAVLDQFVDDARPEQLTERVLVVLVQSVVVTQKHLVSVRRQRALLEAARQDSAFQPVSNAALASG